MAKQPRTFVSLEKWGDDKLDLAHANRLGEHQAEKIQRLYEHQDELRKEVIHLQRCWDKCAELLRNAKAANHKLLMQAHRRSQGGR